jgi:hypothetical protein
MYFNLYVRQIMFNDDLPAAQSTTYKMKQNSTRRTIEWVTISEHKLPMVCCCTLLLLKGLFLTLHKLSGTLSILSGRGTYPHTPH